MQAFALLNDAFLIRQSEHVAERVAPGDGDAGARAEALFRHVLLRAPDAGERARFGDYIRVHGAANACQLLLNSNEFLHLD